MSTITLYASKINQMPSLINDAKKAVKEYKSDLKSLNSKVLTIDNSICNVDDVISSIKSSTQTQGDKIDALDKLKKDVNEFVSEVVRIDGDAADAINKSKDDFYDEYYYLKPECEKSDWEKFKDGCKNVGEWCKEHWKAIVTILIVIAAVVCLFIPGVNAAIAGLAFGKIILGAAAGALMGAISGGLMGGITSVLSGGSFWEGVEEGAFSGTITGAIFGGIGGAGQLAGNVLGKSCAFVEKFGSAIKWTSRISAGISGVMGLYDTAASVVGLFAPDCAFVEFNQKLHSSKLYNGFQMSVSALSIFTGGMRQGMSQVTPSCFVAGTMILTAMGLIAIENIKAGDKVISTDPETMETAEKTVLETYIREVEKLVHLTINGEEIITTFDHPFYVRGRGFVNACELWVGAQLIDVNNTILIVENTRLELAKNSVKVYNFQVEDFHTYFVGECGAWVHNANCKLIKNDDGTYDAELSYKEDWTPEQRAEADAKCKALTEADTKKTSVDGKRKKSKTSKYRKDNAIPSSQDVDHTIDMQLGGIDDATNMNGLDKSVNRSLGSQINYLINDLPEDTILRNFYMK